MANCSNCYNGCTEIVSDRCVKYTGVDIPELGIQNGDTLSTVEEALTTYLMSVLNGTGITIDLSGISICALISQYLPVSGDINIVQISKALIQAACNLQEQVDAVVLDIATIEANYDVNCLLDVSSSSGTHAIVQSVINKLCALEIELDALALDLSTNYVSVANINSYIEAYINSVSSSTLISNKMVPYTAVPFFPTTSILSNFDVTGAGTGDWANIYFCNGQNGTPDLRGRTLVGAIQGMAGLTLDDEVNPINPANPNYDQNTKVGVNEITLDVTQIPSHNHIATTNETGDHTHVYTQYTLDQEIATTGSGVRSLNKNNTQSGSFITESAGNHSHSVSIQPTGDNAPHSNIQPSRGCYYIIYIP
jgi:microcystin-dependent protein